MFYLNVGLICNIIQVIRLAWFKRAEVPQDEKLTLRFVEVKENL
jgi:hypothetical protein